MAWDKHRAAARIEKLLDSVPARDVQVDRFDDTYAQRRAAERIQAESKGEYAGSPILKLPYNKAVLVDGVHVYANILNLDDYLLQDGEETDQSHIDALKFLHLHYAACDALIAEFDLQRVDYHGARLHAVVVSPNGNQGEFLRLSKAIAFSHALAKLLVDANSTIANNRFASSLRIGIDTGQSVGVNSGRGSESEPLFLGKPANNAAKLCEGLEPGIYISERARAAIHENQDSYFHNDTKAPVANVFLEDAYLRSSANELTQRARSRLFGNSDVLKSLDSAESFVFHYKKPPLKTIKYQDLSPSRSIRMGMVSIFADIDGFTDYVASSINETNSLFDLAYDLAKFKYSTKSFEVWLFILKLFGSAD